VVITVCAYVKKNSVILRTIAQFLEERNKMKLRRIIQGIAVNGLILMFSTQAIAYDEGLLRQRLKNVSAMEAIAIANELKWESTDVKSYVTTHEVVFKYSNGQLTKIRLPKDRMLVAVAPYMNQTHQ
jgi:hypothetical protein